LCPTGWQWVGTEKGHCSPFDFYITLQWVFGYTL
jgi:hypothetical protein